MRCILFLLVLAAGPSLAQAATQPGPRTVTCIDSDEIQGREGESDRTILFHMQGGRTWRNTLRGACPGLADASGSRTLVTEQSGTQLCRGDRVRAVEPQALHATGIAGFPACPLGEFTEVSASPHAQEPRP